MWRNFSKFYQLPQATRKKMFLVALLYFAEGLPFGFIYISLPVFLRTEGLDLIKIGLLSLAGFAWTLKPLWAPLVDRYGRKYQWMIGALLGLAINVIAISLLSPHNSLYLSFIFFMAFCSATLDIAVDGYTIELLEEEELGLGNGIRVSAYRIALIGSGGGLVALSDFLGFKASFIALAFIFLALIMLICFLPGVQKKSTITKRSLWEQYIIPIKDLLLRPYIWAVVPFILLFKVGDAMMGSMIYPFWVDKGFSRAEIGLVSGTLGTIASILGSLIGGWITGLIGLGRALWSLGAVQALSNLGYAYAALPHSPRLSVYGASLIESFTGGLGTAAFLAFLMKFCKKDMSASQYALLATLFSFSRSISGALGGFGATRFGYAAFFFYTFLAALPAFFLIPWVLKALDEA